MAAVAAAAVQSLPNAKRIACPIKDGVALRKVTTGPLPTALSLSGLGMLS